MRDEKVIRYEKPELAKYAFLGINGVLTGGNSPIPQGGDIDEECESEFDE